MLGFPGGSGGKESAYKAGDLSSGRPPGGASRILAWRIPWTKEPARLIYGVTHTIVTQSIVHD